MADGTWTPYLDGVEDDEDDHASRRVSFALESAFLQTLHT